MLTKKYRFATLFACLFLLIQELSAQYKVSGGSQASLLAADDTRNRIQVYLVYGTSGVEISYTSSSSVHQWYRYNTRALEAQKISSTQQGTTSVVSNIEEGYGYFVQEGDQITRYIWIIDYQQHAFNISSLQVNAGSDPCSTFRLTGSASMDPLSYQAPNGNKMPVDRTFDVTYSSLTWNEQQKTFSREQKIETVTGDPFATSFPAPLVDTPVQLTGDSFARYFGVEKSAQTDEMLATAIEVHADTTLLSADISGQGSDEGLSAPAQILFTAYANDPVAAMYIWMIYKKDPNGGEDKLLLRFTGEEVEFEFKESGDYIASLEVSNRSGSCTDNAQSFSFSVSDFSIFIPNAFSPGTSPGINDYFTIRYKSIYQFKGWIFNRWGAEVYRWTDPSQGWDGKHNGKYVSPGVYFYVIEFQGSDSKMHKRSGDINVLRSKTSQ